MNEPVRSAKITIHFDSTELYELARKKVREELPAIDLGIRENLRSLIDSSFSYELNINDDTQTFEIIVETEETYFDLDAVTHKVEEAFGVGT